MSFLQTREVFFNQERSPIPYHNFRHKNLVRPGSKYPIWNRSQPISYKAKFSQKDNTYLVDLKYNTTYQNILGKTKVRPIFMPWKAWKVTLQLPWMSFLQNRDVCFNQESLPITYYSFHHKSLVRPKSKSPNWQRYQPISYKANFSQRETMHISDVKFNITYQNNQGKIQVRPLLRPLMSLSDTHLSFQLTAWFFSLMGTPDIMLVLIKTINHFYFY